MIAEGICEKMKASVGETAEVNDSTLGANVVYQLVTSHIHTDLMPVLNNPLKISWSGKIYCVGCGANTNKSYSQGYCYKCFISKASCDLCMVKPETCHFGAGTCREPQWAESFCFSNHIVYLANSSGLKVGITRKSQLPTRWLDQGATQALPIFEVASRHQSGIVESLFAQSVPDKTNWRKMLQGESESIDLAILRDQLLDQYDLDLSTLASQGKLQAIELDKEYTRQFVYPVLQYPKKITSLNLEKQAIEDTLLGIKGQYLIFQSGVINLRKYTGYELKVEFS